MPRTSKYTYTPSGPGWISGAATPASFNNLESWYDQVGEAGGDQQMMGDEGGNSAFYPGRSEDYQPGGYSDTQVLTDFTFDQLKEIAGGDMKVLKDMVAPLSSFTGPALEYQMYGDPSVARNHYFKNLKQIADTEGVPLETLLEGAFNSFKQAEDPDFGRWQTVGSRLALSLVGAGIDPNKYVDMNQVAIENKGVSDFGQAQQGNWEGTDGQKMQMIFAAIAGGAALAAGGTTGAAASNSAAEAALLEGGSGIGGTVGGVELGGVGAEAAELGGWGLDAATGAEVGESVSSTGEFAATSEEISKAVASYNPSSGLTLEQHVQQTLKDLPNLPPTPPTGGADAADNLYNPDAVTDAADNVYNPNNIGNPGSTGGNPYGEGLTDAADNLYNPNNIDPGRLNEPGFLDWLKGVSGLTGADLLRLAGSLGAAGLEMYGSSQQSDDLNALAQQYINFGAPSRARYEGSMTPGFDPMSIPGYSGAVDNSSKSILKGLSTSGNPFGNPGGLIEANKQVISGTALPAIQEYQRLNANTGFGSSMNAAVPLQTAAIGADNSGYAAVGHAINSFTNPNPYRDWLKMNGYIT